MWFIVVLLLTLAYRVACKLIESLDDNADKKISYNEWIRLVFLFLVVFAVIIEGLTTEQRYSDVPLTFLIVCSFGIEMLEAYIKRNDGT